MQLGWVNMNEQNREAMQRWGTKKILGDLANVSDSPEGYDAAGKFIARYGPLGPLPQDPEAAVVKYAKLVREAWTAKTEQNIQERKYRCEVLNGFLEEIFAAGDPFKGERSVIRANFEAGKWEPMPRTLLHVLAIELMRSRKMLHRCERPECGRFLVKEFSRDRYCSLACSETMREMGQTRWALEHRKELNQRRRKPKGKGRQ
jgi:hypothetical protein